jgi:hypothetical protein
MCVDVFSFIITFITVVGLTKPPVQSVLGAFSSALQREMQKFKNP